MSMLFEKKIQELNDNDNPRLFRNRLAYIFTRANCTKILRLRRRKLKSNPKHLLIV